MLSIKAQFPKKYATKGYLCFYYFAHVPCPNNCVFEYYVQNVPRWILLIVF